MATQTEIKNTLLALFSHRKDKDPMVHRTYILEKIHVAFSTTSPCLILDEKNCLVFNELMAKEGAE